MSSFSNSLKIVKNQGFTSFDILLVLGSVGLVAALVLPILMSGLESNRIDQAQRDMKKIAQESTFLKLALYSKSSPERSLASTAAPSREEKVDPWGQPYNMQTIKNSRGEAAYFVITSSGPNGRVDTSYTQPKVQSGRVAMKFSGDDLGHVMPLK